MSDETGDADYRLVAATVRRALKDAARGDVEAQAFLDEMLPNTRTVNQRMGDWIRREAAKGVRRFETVATAATTPAATTPTANAGNTGAPPVKESTSKQMGRIIRQATGRKG